MPTTTIIIPSIDDLARHPIQPSKRPRGDGRPPRSGVSFPRCEREGAESGVEALATSTYMEAALQLEPFRGVTVYIRMDYRFMP